MGGASVAMHLLRGNNQYVYLLQVLDTAESYSYLLKNRGYDVGMAFTAEECLKTYIKSFQNAVVINAHPYDAVILDYKLPDRNGLEVAKEILAINPHQRIIFVTADIDVLTGPLEQLKMPVEVLQKPIPNEDLVNTIEDKEIYDELERLALNPEEFKKVGLSHEVLRSLLDIFKKAKSFAIFFILTESAGNIWNNLQHVAI